MVARYRGNRTIAEMRQAQYERQQQENQRKEQERIAQERAERVALEKERLQQLADAQPDASLFHGEPSFNSTFDPTMGYGGSGVYARPPTGYNYEDDIYEITYYEMFGEPSLADQDKFQAEFEKLLGSEDTWSEAERQQIEATRDSFMAGEIDPWSMNVKNMYAKFNIEQRTENAEQLEEAGVDSYIPRATTLAEAKEHADEVYMEVLQNAYDENPTTELRKLIEQGPLDFDKAEDVKLYNSLAEDSIQRQAFDAQGTVVSDFLNRKEGDAFDSESLEQGETFSWGWGGKAGTTLLNTGTIVGAPDVNRDNVVFAEFGKYGNYSYDDEPESILDNPILDVIAAATGLTIPLSLIRGGDIGDILKSIVVGQVISKVIPENFIENNLNKLGINAETFGMDPETFTDVLGDFQKDLEQGKNIAEAALGAFGDGAEEILEGVGGSLVDVVQTVVKPIGDAVEGIIQPIEGVLDSIEDFETPEAIKKVGDSILEGIDTAKDKVTPIIESIDKNFQPVGDAIQDAIIDPIDAVIDAADSHVGDVWEHAGVTILTGGSTSQIAEAYARGMYGEKIGEKGGEILQEVFGNLGIDKTLLGLSDEEWKEWNEEVATRMAEDGISLADSIERQITGDVKGLAKDKLEDVLGVAGKSFEDAFGGFVDLAEDALGGVGEVLETVGGTVVDAINATGIPEVIETVGGEAIDVVEGVGGEVGKIAEDLGGTLIDTGGAIVEAIGGPVENIVQTGGNIIEEILPDIDIPEIDIDTPELDIPKIGGPVAEQPKSQVAGLFGKELGEIYKHDIIELPKLFSDERIQGMLSRKYRV